MDRYMRHALFAGGLGLLLAAAPGCKTPRTEAPPEPAFSGHGAMTDRPQVGFSSEPPAAQANPMPNGLPGSGQVPGAYGNTVPTFSPSGPQSGRNLGDQLLVDYRHQSAVQRASRPDGRARPAAAAAITFADTSGRFHEDPL